MTHKLLIIDDHPAVHALIKAQFKSRRYEVISAYDGRSGLDAAARHVPDVILLDIDMPAMHGHEVCRQLKARQSTHSIPVIFLTAAASIESQVRGLDHGACDYVTKPFHAKDLQARVRAALRSRSEINRIAGNSVVDELTGVFDRKYFEMRLDAELAVAWRSRRPLGCVLLDIDGMRSINDSFGREAGEDVLRKAAQSLQGICRRQDVLCRFDQGEFAILVSDTSRPIVADFSERARVAVRCGAPILLNCDLQVTASVGFAVLRFSEGWSVVAEAREALARSKSLGGDRVSAGKDLTWLQLAA